MGPTSTWAGAGAWSQGAWPQEAWSQTQGDWSQGRAAKPTREEKRAGRREKQLEAQATKADAEARYFYECQQQAQRSGEAKAAQRGLAGAEADKRETALFEKQGVHGIDFGKEWPEVTVSGAGAKSAAALTDFAALGPKLPPFLSRNIGLMRYSTPTPIQQYAIPLSLAGNDLMCCAQTGSGKTAAFLIPICAALSAKSTGASTVGATGAARPRAVVMAPTRELALQIDLEAQKLTNRSAMRVVCVYGGADQRAQARALAIGCDVVVATPGRLNDFVGRDLASLASTGMLVLDEADRMLDMGFEPQIRRLVAAMPAKEKRQTLLFSATFPAEIQNLAKAFLRPYVWIAVGRVGSTVGGITQRIVEATADKRKKLSLVVQALGERSGRTLIFVEKKRSATWVKKMLLRGGPEDAGSDERFEPISAEDIHGDRSQSQREAALAHFRSGACTVLVATDVAARGLDVAGVEHVINMDLPFAKDDFDSYVHRIGRTGRNGHPGLATSLFVPGEAPKQGNGKIAGSLAALLQDSGQEVPAFLGGGGGDAGGGGHAGKARPTEDVRGGGGRAERRQQPAATPAAPKPANGELRMSEDGSAYSRADFIKFFGGTTEWDAAAPAAQTAKPQAQASENGRSTRTRGGGRR